MVAKNQPLVLVKLPGGGRSLIFPTMMAASKFIEAYGEAQAEVEYSFGDGWVTRQPEQCGFESVPDKTEFIDPCENCGTLYTKPKDYDGIETDEPITYSLCKSCADKFAEEGTIVIPEEEKTDGS